MAIIQKDPLKDTYTVTSPDGNLIADDVPGSMLPSKPLPPAPSAAVSPPVATGPRPAPARVTPEMLPEPVVEAPSGNKYPSTPVRQDPDALNLAPPSKAEVAALRPNPYEPKIKFVNNPSGGLDLVTADGVPIKLGVPEDLVPTELRRLGASRAEPLIPSDQVEPPSPVETYDPNVQADLDRLLANMAEAGTLPPEEIAQLQAGATPIEPMPDADQVRPEPARTKMIAPPKPLIPPALVPAAPSNGDFPRPAETPQGPLALYNQTGITPPPPLVELGAMAQAAPGTSENMSVADVQPNMTPVAKETPEDRLKWFENPLAPTPAGASVPAAPAAPAAAKPVLIPAKAPVSEAPAAAGTELPGTALPEGVEQIPTGRVDPRAADIARPRIVVGGGQKIPARWELGAAGRTQQLLLSSPELEQIRAEEEDALWAKKANIMNAAVEQQKTLDEAAVNAAKAKEESRAKLAEIEAEDLRRKEAVAARMANLDRKRAELADARAAFNPNRKWEDRNIFSKIFARLVLGMGNLGAFVSGGKNFAWEEFRSEINDDIEAQKAEIAAKKGDVDTAFNLIAQEQTNWRTPAARDAAAKILMDQVVENEARELAARRGGQAAMAQAMGLIDMINQDKLEQRKIIEQAEAGYETRQSVYRKAAVSGGRVISYEDNFKKNLKFYKERYPDDPQKAADEAAAAAATQYNREAAPVIYNREIRGMSKQIASGKLSAEQADKIAASNTQAQLVNLSKAFEYGMTGQVKVVDAQGHEQVLTGKAAAEHIAKGALLVGRAKANRQAFMESKAQMSVAAQVQLLQQINAWRDTMKAWRDAVKRGDPEGIVQKYKDAASVSLETRSQAFLTRLVPGTNLGTQQAEKLISGPLSVFDETIEADYKTVTARIIHNMVAAKLSAGQKVTADQIVDEYWDVVQGGSHTPITKEEVKSILKTQGPRKGYIEPPLPEGAVPLDDVIEESGGKKTSPAVQYPH